MALNSSGPISLGGTTAGQSIALENGGSGTSQISLNDAAVRGLAGVPSGAIIMPTNFYGKSNAIYMIANWGQINMSALAIDSSNNIYVGGGYIYGGLTGFSKVNANGTVAITRTFTSTNNSGRLYWLGFSSATSSIITGGTLGAAYNWTASTFSNSLTYRLDTNSGGTRPPNPSPFGFQDTQPYNGTQLPNGNIVSVGTLRYSYCCSTFVAPQWRLFNSSYGVINGAGTNTSSTESYTVGSDPNNNFMVGVQTYNGSTYLPQYLKYNSSGSYLGSVALSLPGGQPAGVAGDSSGNIYAAFRNSNYASHFVKFNTSYTADWKIHFNSSNSDSAPFQCYNVAVDSSGNSYVAGNSYRSSTSTSRIVVFKFNSAGTLQWARQLTAGNTLQFINNNSNLKIMPNGSICFCYWVGGGSSAGGGFIVLPPDGSKTGTYATTQTGSFTWAANTDITVTTSALATAALGNPLGYAFTWQPTTYTVTQQTVTNGDVNII